MDWRDIYNSMVDTIQLVHAVGSQPHLYVSMSIWLVQSVMAQAVKEMCYVFGWLFKDVVSTAGVVWHQMRKWLDGYE